jgi:hypothetical protein
MERVFTWTYEVPTASTQPEGEANQGPEHDDQRSGGSRSLSDSSGGSMRNSITGST